MSNAVRLTNFTDFDRLLVGKNLLITILGSALAFFLAFYQVYIPLPIIPYNLSLAIAVMIIVTVFTSNIASAILVGIVGSIGIVAADGVVDFILGYILINLILMIFLGYLSDRLQLILKWTRFYLFYGIVFSAISILLGILSNPVAEQYSDINIDVGTGGEIGTGLGLPVLDLAVFGSLLILSLIMVVILRGEIQLDQRSRRRYRFFGGFFFILGQLVTLVPLLLLSIKISEAQLVSISTIDYHLKFLSEIFTHGSTFGVYGSPTSIFLIMAVTTTFTCIGLSLLLVGKYGGNLEGTKGGSAITYLAAPTAIILYFSYASYQVQSLIDPSALYISIELYPVFAAMIWTVYYLNHLAARVVLFILDKLK